MTTEDLTITLSEDKIRNCGEIDLKSIGFDNANKSLFAFKSTNHCSKTKQLRKLENPHQHSLPSTARLRMDFV